MEQSTRAGVNRESPDCWSEDSYAAHCYGGREGKPLIIVVMANSEGNLWSAIQVCFLFPAIILSIFLLSSAF